MRFSKIKKGTKEYIQRFRAKKITNIIISSLLFLFGLSGIITITIFQEHGDIVRSYRFLTVNSTTFTSILSFIFVFLSIKEIRKGKKYSKFRAHAWVQIKFGKKKYGFDPEFNRSSDAKKLRKKNK